MFIIPQDDITNVLGQILKIEENSTKSLMGRKEKNWFCCSYSYPVIIL